MWVHDGKITANSTGGGGDTHLWFGGGQLGLQRGFVLALAGQFIPESLYLRLLALNELVLRLGCRKLRRLSGWSGHLGRCGRVQGLS